MNRKARSILRGSLESTGPGRARTTLFFRSFLPPCGSRKVFVPLRNFSSGRAMALKVKSRWPKSASIEPPCISEKSKYTCLRRTTREVSLLGVSSSTTREDRVSRANCLASLEAPRRAKSKSVHFFFKRRSRNGPPTTKRSEPCALLNCKRVLSCFEIIFGVEKIIYRGNGGDLEARLTLKAPTGTEADLFGYKNFSIFLDQVKIYIG